MPTVSKGQVRILKLRVDKLSRAVPTLDLRRKQLNREILNWEEELEELIARVEGLDRRMAQSPYPEIERIVTVDRVETEEVNIAGVMLTVVDVVHFHPVRYSLFATPPSFDAFTALSRELIEAREQLRYKERALEILNEELIVTTQRINLFEKRLIPDAQADIRYIRGRLEDGERSSVIVAKIAQAERIGQQHTSEMA